MAKIAVVFLFVIGSGCGAAKSALGALGGGSKPSSNVTVVNEIHVPSVETPPHVAPAPKQRSPRRAILGGAIAGSIVGGMIGALHGVDAEHIGTERGAGVGYVVHAAE
jgi:hypothetical protein